MPGLSKRRRMPTEAQSGVLCRIAGAGGAMMLTHDPVHGDRYSDLRGQTIPEPTAKVLIRNGWVTAERSSMFDTAPQVWRTRTPNGDEK